MKMTAGSRNSILSTFLWKLGRKNVERTYSKFVSSKLWFDIQSMCLGFQSMVHIKLKKFPHSVIKPAIVNQDCVENHFCQVRACNGQNNNPTYQQQESTQNSIRFGQTVISRKSNAGNNSSELTACSLHLPSSHSTRWLSDYILDYVNIYLVIINKLGVIGA